MGKWRRQGWSKTSKREITGAAAARKAQARRRDARDARDVPKRDANTVSGRGVPVKDKR